MAGAYTCPDGMVLAEDGLGVVSFGQSDDRVAAVLAGSLGPPINDVTQEWQPDVLAEVGPPASRAEFSVVPLGWPDAVGDNSVTTGLTSRHPFSRGLIWDNLGVVYFGGPSVGRAAVQRLVRHVSGLHDVVRLGVGNTVADFPGLLHTLVYGDAICTTGILVAGAIVVGVESSVGSCVGRIGRPPTTRQSTS